MDTDGAKRRGAENAEERGEKNLCDPLRTLRLRVCFVIRVHLCPSVVQSLGLRKLNNPCGLAIISTMMSSA